MRLTRAQVAAGLVMLGLMLLAASALGWLRTEVISVAGTTKTTLTGFQLAPLSAAAALVVATGGLALGFARRLGARIICAIAAIAAAAAAWSFASVLFATPAELAVTYTQVTGGTGDVASAMSLPTIWVGTLLAVLAIALAFVGLMGAGRWPRTVSRFDIAAVPTDSPMSPDPRAQAIEDWDALRRGEDPTQ